MHTRKYVHAHCTLDFLIPPKEEHEWRWGPGRPQKKNTNGDGVQGDPKRRTRMAMESMETPKKKNTNGDGVQGDPKEEHKWRWGPGRSHKKNTNGDGVQGDPKRRTRMALGFMETPKEEHEWRWGPGRPQKKNTNGVGIPVDPKRRTRMAMGSRETPKEEHEWRWGLCHVQLTWGLTTSTSQLRDNLYNLLIKQYLDLRNFIISQKFFLKLKIFF